MLSSDNPAPERDGVWPSDSDELMDLYDELRRPIGRTMRRGAPVAPGEYLAVFHVCVFNSAGQLLIQRRQDTKRSFPSLWDITAGGAVQAGESSRAAAEREVREELGFSPELAGIRPCLTVNFDDGFDDIYAVEREISLRTLRLQASEVQDARWAALPEVLALSERGAFVPYHTGFLQLLFQMRARMGFLREA